MVPYTALLPYPLVIERVLSESYLQGCKALMTALALLFLGRYVNAGTGCQGAQALGRTVW